MRGLQVDGDGTEIAFIRAAAYSNTYEVGDTFDDYDGITRTVVADGGWIDVMIDVPDSVTQVELRPMYTSTDQKQDMALREFQWS